MPFTRTRALVAAALLGVVPAPAAAQDERPAEFDSWTIPGWTFTPSVSVAGLWDSNVALAGDQAEGAGTDSDRLFMIEPHGQLDYRGRRTEFTAGYKGYIRRYLDVEQLNGYHQRAFVSLERLVSRRATLFIRNHFADVPTTDEVQLNGLPYSRTGSRSNRFAAELQTRLTRYDDVEVRYDNTWVSFDDEQGLLRGGVVHSVRLDYARRLDERTRLGAEYRVRQSTMNKRDRVMWFHDIGGVLSRAFTRTVTLELAGGYSILRDSRITDARGGAYVRADLTRDGQRSTLGLGYERSFAPTFGHGGSSNSHELRGYFQMPFTRNRLYARVGGNWRRTDPLLLEELHLDSVSLENTIGYGPARWFRMELFHVYTRQDSRITGGEVNRHRAGAQLVIAQPMRIQ